MLSYLHGRSPFRSGFQLPLPSKQISPNFFGTGAASTAGIDTEKIDETILRTPLFDHARWRQGTERLRFGSMNRLCEKGFISDLVGKGKSVVLTYEGLRQSEWLFRKLFTKQSLVHAHVPR
jgi:hypothetical protein